MPDTAMAPEIDVLIEAEGWAGVDLDGVAARAVRALAEHVLVDLLLIFLVLLLFVVRSLE